VAPCGFRSSTTDETRLTISSISRERRSEAKTLHARSFPRNSSAEAIFPGRRTGRGGRLRSTIPPRRVRAAAASFEMRFLATRSRATAWIRWRSARSNITRSRIGRPPQTTHRISSTHRSARGNGRVCSAASIISCRPHSSFSSAMAGTIAATPAVLSTASAAGPRAIRQPARMSLSGATSQRAAAGRGY
jgi:hypothetical protein